MPRILLVEDNEMNRDMLSRRLARKGYEVSIAIDGQQGLAMASRGGFDLVLMDMSLPEMDGWEITRRLRADAPTRSLPVIALTAHAMAGDREKALEAGCSDYDSKPVDFPRLLAKIEALLGGPSPAGEGEAIREGRPHRETEGPSGRLLREGEAPSESLRLAHDGQEGVEGLPR